MDKQLILLDKLSRASSPYASFALKPLTLSPDWTSSEEMGSRLEKWLDSYNELHSQDREVSTAKIDTEDLFGLLAELASFIQESKALSLPWPVCRHVISIALLLRFSERFIQHLNKYYGTDDSWSDEKRAHAAYDMLKKVGIPLISLVQIEPEPDQMLENEMYWFYRHRVELVEKIRQREHPPFTLLRIIELLLLKDDSAWHSNFWKWCKALCKNILDPSTSYPCFSVATKEHLSDECMRKIYANYKLDNPPSLEDYVFI